MKLAVPSRALLGALLIVTLHHPVIAQLYPSLALPQSPAAIGMGGLSTSVPTDDPLAILANPGELGIDAMTTRASAAFYTPYAKWSGSYILPVENYESMALEGGVNLQRDFGISAPLSVGIGYSRTHFNYLFYDEEVGNTYPYSEASDNVTLGAGLDSYVILGIGGTLHYLHVDFSRFSHAWNYDLGVIATLPLVERLFPESYRQTSGFAGLGNISIGCAYLNGGDGIFSSSTDVTSQSPIPHSTTLGASMEIGLVHIGEGRWKVIAITLDREARDELTMEYDGNDTTGDVLINYNSNRSGFGNIQPFKNLIDGAKGRNIDLSQGIELNLAEIVFLRWGSYAGLEGNSNTTNGYGLRLAGVYKALAELDEGFAPGWFAFAKTHVDLAYNWSRYNTSGAVPFPWPADGTVFQSLSIFIH
jgi:hypothetical protein